jgi:hypothetical protein
MHKIVRGLDIRSNPFHPVGTVPLLFKPTDCFPRPVPEVPLDHAFIEIGQL